MPSYAADTSVSSERSQSEIQSTLRRYGADQFMMGWSAEQAAIEFLAKGRRVRFVLPMPNREAKEFKWTNHTSPRQRTPKQQEESWEQACRQRWRALNLVVKAKLEAVEAGISTFENEFLANIVLPSGQTVAETIMPGIARAYEANSMEPLMPSLRAIESSQ